MGSSCTTATKPSSKNNPSPSQSYNTQNSKKAASSTVSKQTFEECFTMKNNANNNQDLPPIQQRNNKYSDKSLNNISVKKTLKVQTKQLYNNNSNNNQDDTHTMQKEISPQSTNYPQQNSCNTTLRFESPKTHLNGNKTSPNISRRKISYIEIFILERKRYMQEKGVFNYTPYTVLPAPKLKKLENNSLFKKRKSSLAHIPSCTQSSQNNTLCNTNSTHSSSKMFNTMSINSLRTVSNEFCSARKESSPTQMPQGDCDLIKIEI